MAVGLSLTAAFLGGVLTAASPCALAAVPVAIGFVGGFASTRRQAWMVAGGMALGMTLALTALGVAAARMGLLMGALPGAWTRGVGLGLIALGVLVAWRPPSLSALLTRLLYRRVSASGVGGGIVLGALMGTVMTPCATPALVAVLTLVAASASDEGALLQGAGLLTCYSLGHSSLILVAGTSPDLSQALARRLTAVPMPGPRFFGGLIVATGAWLFLQPVFLI